MRPYIETQLAEGARLHHVTRHMLGLYQGQFGGRQYRRHLSERAHKPESGAAVLREAWHFVRVRPSEQQPRASGLARHALRRRISYNGCD